MCHSNFPPQYLLLTFGFSIFTITTRGNVYNILIKMQLAVLTTVSGAIFLLDRSSSCLVKIQTENPPKGASWLREKLYYH